MELGCDGNVGVGRMVVGDVEFEPHDRDDIEFISVLVIETTVLIISCRVFFFKRT